MRSFCKRLLDHLLPLHYYTFVYLLSFMREVLSQRAYNRQAGGMSIHCIFWCGYHFLSCVLTPRSIYGLHFPRFYCCL